MTLYPTLNVIFWNIEPETNGTSVFENYRISIHTKSDICILLGVRILGMETVCLKAHGIIAIMNLTICSVSQRQIQIICPPCTCSVIDNIPFIDISLTAFEVPKNNRAFTELELNVGSRLAAHIQCRSNIAYKVCRCMILINGYELQAIESTKVCIINRKCYIIGAETDFMQTVINRCLNRNGCSLSERNCNYRLFKRNCIRSCNVNSTLTDNLSVVNHLRCYSAFGSVGGKHTVFDGSHAFFLDRPCNIIRDIYLGTNGIGSKCIKSYSTAGSIVVIVRAYGCLSKLTIIGSSRDYQEGIRGRSFAAV